MLIKNNTYNNNVADITATSDANKETIAYDEYGRMYYASDDGSLVEKEGDYNISRTQ